VAVFLAYPLDGVQEAVLVGSTTSGPAVRLCMDRRYLRRALQLGFTEVEVIDAEKIQENAKIVGGHLKK
jgi:hypothetical protein